MSTLEKKIENSILDYLNLIQGCMAFKVQTTGVYDKKINGYRKAGKGVILGTSDILGCYKGYFFALEVKTPKTATTAKTYPSKEQKDFIDMVRKNGGTAYVVYNLKQVERIIDIIKNQDRFSKILTNTIECDPSG
jgi:penicillin-binding protein-related factor A (putative recombinase)